MFPNWITCFAGILIVLTNLRPCHSTDQLPERTRRAIDFPMQWRPVQSGAPLNDHLISISSFDTTNKAQLAQIAHHNAHILRHIKRVPGVPVTQYLNPFPMFSSGAAGPAGAAGLPSAPGGSAISSSSSVIDHPLHHGGAGASSGSAAAKQHYIVQTSNIVVHPAPASANSAYTSAPLHPAAHPNSLHTSSSNMAQTIVPFGHVQHKHQYFAKQPTFLLNKPSELSASAYKFLNAIHPSTTGKGVFSGMLKMHHQSSTPFFSSTTSRIPIIRDSTLAPLAYHRAIGSTSKPHPVGNNLQNHLTLSQRAKSPTGPHVDELAAHQSHLISSLAQFAAVPNFIRAAEVAQKLPRPQQGPAFAPLPDHFNTFFGKNNFGSSPVRFQSTIQQPPTNTMSSVQFGQQQQLRQQFAQQQQQQQHHSHQHAQLLKEVEHHHNLPQPQQQAKQQNPHQHQQQTQQHSQQYQIQSHIPKQQQYNQNQQYHVAPSQQTQQLPQNNIAHIFQNQQQQHLQPSSQSQHQESYYVPLSAIGHNNQTRPVYEANQSSEHLNLPFKKMPPFENESSTRSPGAYLPPQPSVAPSVLSPFFQQVQQQQHQQDLDDQLEHEEHQQHLQQQHEDEERRREQEQHHQQQQHFYFASTSAPEHHLEIRPSPPDEYYYPQQNQSHQHFQPDTISFHHQHLDNNPHHESQQIPPFNQIEDEFSLNLVPPVPSYPSHKDTSAFRRPSHGTRGSQSTLVHPTADTEQAKAMEILNKYNIPAISPLQDANRYAYNARPVSSMAPETVSVSQFHLELPSPTQLTHFTTTKPNVFRQLNRPSESEYKQHKVMHPLYTGGPKRPGGAPPSYAPVTAAPGRDTSAVTHSFFTIEDAITLSPQHGGHRHARPTSVGGIEANLNRPREEEITEVITMRATSEDDELLQHLDATTPRPNSSSVRTKHRRRRPRPSSTSTSTTEQVDDGEENAQQEEQEQVKQGLWETNRFPSNHRETPAEPTPTTAKGTSPIPAPRHRTRNRGRPTVNQLSPEVIGLSEKQPTRSRKPTQRPAEESRPTLTTRSRTTQLPQTTENYEEPITVDLRDNIFLANLQQRRRPPHSTKSTVFEPNTVPTSTYAKPVVTTQQEELTTRSVIIPTTPSPPAVEPETVATPRGTRPSILTTNNYGYQQTNTVEQATNANTDIEPEEMTLASETIANTIITMAPTIPAETTSIVRATSASIRPSTTTSTVINTDSLPVIVPNNHRVRQRLRLKEATSNEITNVQSTSSTSTTISSEDTAAELTENNEPLDFDTYRPVSVRLPIAKDSSSTRTTTSISDENTSARIPTRQNAISKFDPKNRPRFSVKDYRQRLTVSSTSGASPSTTTEGTTSTLSTTTRKYPTRSRVLPDLRIKSRTTSAAPPNNDDVSSTTARGNSVSSEREETSDESARKRFTPKERRTSSINESYERSSARTTSTTTPTPSVTGRTTRTRNPTSRRMFSSSTTTPSSIESSVTRVPTIRKFAGISLRRPPQPSLRQRIALSQLKKTSTTEAPVTLDPSLIDGGASDEATTISKLFNIDHTISVENSNDDDFTGSTNTENYKMETAIMKIAKDDHSYRPYAHSSITPRSRSRTSSTTPQSATEPMNVFHELLLPVDDDDQSESNQINGNSGVDMNGSPSEHSERVAELTRFGTNQFQSVNTAAGSATPSRRVPSYFTIATEDPILPIEAFFPKMNSNGGNRG